LVNDDKIQTTNKRKTDENEEIKQLIAELRASMTEMMAFFQQFAIAFQQQQKNKEDANDETSININGFFSKANILEMNLQLVQPHLCLLQECFRSENRSSITIINSRVYTINSENRYPCRRDLHSTQRKFETRPDKF
ncbi:hypothetical protein RFI_37724, partial [Reticulomyxa filosa]